MIPLASVAILTSSETSLPRASPLRLGNQRARKNWGELLKEAGRGGSSPLPAPSPPRVSFDCAAVTPSGEAVGMPPESKGILTRALNRGQ